MNSFRKMLQKKDDRVALKPSSTMPYESSSQARVREPPAYYGKTPLKKSDIVYVEQAPGILTHGTPSQYTYNQGPSRANSNARANLQDRFPRSAEYTEGLPRTGFRALSLNSNSRRPQLSTDYSNASGQEGSTRAAVASPASGCWPSKYDEFMHETNPNVLREKINRYPVAPVCDESCPEHMRPMYFDMDDPCEKNSIRWYIKLALNHGRPLDVRAGGRYRRIVDPMATVPAIPMSSKHAELMNEINPTVLRGMINSYPLAPVGDDRCPEHMRPMYFDMDDQRDEKSIRWYIKLALHQGRPLDVRAGGRYHRVVDAKA